MKVTIVGGGGGIGASVAFNLLLAARGFELVLLDTRPEMIASHALDLEQVLEQGATGSVRGGDRRDLADADVIVVSAAVPLAVNASRMVYLADNAAILRGVVELLPTGWDGILLVVTNPVDALCTWLTRSTGLDRRRLLGYTLNDSLRLRTGLAAALGLPPGSVEAWMVGEHGDGSVALYDRVSAGGVAVQVTPAQRAQAEDYVRNWYVRHVALDSGRSSTWTSGLGIARMLAAIDADAGELWPASLLLEGEYGIDGVALSVPVRLGRGGAQQIVEWELTAEQRKGMQRAAALVREATAAIEF